MIADWMKRTCLLCGRTLVFTQMWAVLGGWWCRDRHGCLRAKRRADVP